MTFDISRGSGSVLKKEYIMVDILHRDSFSHEHRVNYFEMVLGNFPVNSLEFFDPDTGPEVKNPTQRHLMYEEVGQLFGRMGRQSILMICQHVPRVTGDRYIRKRCRELAALTHVRPDTITDNEIVFFSPDKKSPVQDPPLRRAGGIRGPVSCADCFWR